MLGHAVTEGNLACTEDWWLLPSWSAEEDRLVIDSSGNAVCGPPASTGIVGISASAFEAITLSLNELPTPNGF